MPAALTVGGACSVAAMLIRPDPYLLVNCWCWNAFLGTRRSPILSDSERLRLPIGCIESKSKNVVEHQLLVTERDGEIPVIFSDPEVEQRGSLLSF